jgi:hypothetical protein
MDCPKCENTEVDITDIDGDLFDQYNLKCQCYECGYNWSVVCQATVIRTEEQN